MSKATTQPASSFSAPSRLPLLFRQGDEASLEGSLPKKGPKGDFWGNTSPASSVVASSQQEATGEQPAPLSPATPAT